MISADSIKLLKRSKRVCNFVHSRVQECGASRTSRNLCNAHNYHTIPDYETVTHLYMKGTLMEDHTVLLVLHLLTHNSLLLTIMQRSLFFPHD